VTPPPHRRKVEQPALASSQMPQTSNSCGLEKVGDNRCSCHHPVFVKRRFESTSLWLKTCIVLLALAGLAWLLTGSEIILGLAAGLAGVAVLALVADLLDVLGVPWHRWRDR
jgi:hypothetical protein